MQIPEEKKLTTQYAEIPGNSRREFYDGKFPGIPEREFPVALNGMDWWMWSMKAQDWYLASFGISFTYLVFWSYGA